MTTKPLSPSMKKLWGTRFQSEPLEEIMAFMSARDLRGRLPVDERILPYDIWHSKAYSLRLYHGGAIDKKTAKSTLMGFQALEESIQRRQFKLDPNLEDVHTNIQAFFREKLGIRVSGSYRLGRNTNDDVVTDIRLAMRDYVLQYCTNLTQLIQTLSAQARIHTQTILPGFCNLQYAMPSTWAHYLMSFAAALNRDLRRFQQWYENYDVSPAGAGIAFGTSVKVDRNQLATDLGYATFERNGLDVIATRGEPESDFVHAIQLLMQHLSMVSETLRFFSISEQPFMVLPEFICVGSSVHPQRMTPDALEIIEGRTRTIHGIANQISNIMTGKISSYHRSGQWIKYAVFDAIDESLAAPAVIEKSIDQLELDEDYCYEQSKKHYIYTTDFLELLVLKYKIPFREAKDFLESAIKYAEENDLHDLTPEILHTVAATRQLNLERLDPEDISHNADPLALINRRIGAPDGPHPTHVQAQIEKMENEAQAASLWTSEKIAHLLSAKQSLDHAVIAFLKTS